jgi:ABC-2 type transport system ATP-binding protein
VASLLAAGTTGGVRVRLADPPAGRAVLERAGFTVSALPDAWRVSGISDPAAVTKALSDAGHYLTELSPISADLESVFLQLTAESDQPAHPDQLAHPGQSQAGQPTRSGAPR